MLLCTAQLCGDYLCYALHSYVGTIFVMHCTVMWGLSSALISSPQNSLHPPETEIKSSKDGVWLPMWRGSNKLKRLPHTQFSHPVECICFNSLVNIFIFYIYIFFGITFSISVYIMCACLFSALSRRVGALQMSIIIIIIYQTTSREFSWECCKMIHIFFTVKLSQNSAHIFFFVFLFFFFSCANNTHYLRPCFTYDLLTTFMPVQARPKSLKSR